MLAGTSAFLTASPLSIDNNPPMEPPKLLIGGAVFNYQYTDTPEATPVAEILDKALANPLTAGIDTSPYYGPSEQLIGDALRQLNRDRLTYFLATKAGRIALDDFDYSAAAIRALVLRSCQRLNTDYFDIIYLHDVEFVDDAGVDEAIGELFELKAAGYIRNVGILGYPVPLLVEICQRWHAKGKLIDAVQLYCNGCIQNTTLFDLVPKFKEAGVKYVFNSLILSMSLLRRQPTHKFHPASTQLKQRIDDVAQKLYTENQQELADVATRYALSRSFADDSGIDAVNLGVLLVAELDNAIAEYQRRRDDPEVYAKVQLWIGDQMNVTWDSGRVRGRG